MHRALIPAAFTVFLFVGTGTLLPQEKEVPPDKIPKAVMDALLAKFPKAKIDKCTKEKEGGDTVYDIEFKQEGRKFEADIKEDGTFINYEKEIPVKDLPKVVKEAIDKKYPKATLKEAMEETEVKGKEEKLSAYEVILVTADNKKLEVRVSPDGKILEEEGAQKQEKKELPKGSEKAVAAVRAAFPKAEIDEAVEPKGFGGSGGKGTPLYWTVRFHTGEKKQELSVTPDGAILRLPTPVEVKDLPKAVADAVAKAAPGETIKSAEKSEMRATMKYVALDKAQVQRYAVDVKKDGKTTRYVVSPDGKSAKATDIRAEKKAEKPEKELDIPKKAAKAVAAIKALYPDAVVVKITHEVFDGGTGEIDILTYEIEFVTKGIEREMVASPEGVIPHLWANVEVKDLPKAVSDAVAKAAPDAKIDKARAFELRASLRFGALETPRIFYTVQVEMDDKTRSLKVKPDGSLIKEFKFPKK